MSTPPAPVLHPAVYWFAGLKRAAGSFLAFLASLLLVTLVAEAWGLLIGAVAMNPKKAQVGVVLGSMEGRFCLPMGGVHWHPCWQPCVCARTRVCVCVCVCLASWRVAEVVGWKL